LERININKIPGLSAYKLSHIVSHLKFFKPSLRYPNRVDRTKSNVLRALCDRYPNVWAGLPEIADKAKCSTSQARRALRELEFKDRLIVDVNSRLTWRRDENGRWVLQGPDGHTQGKRGGRGKKATVQYFICDRKILNIYHQQEAHERDKKAHSKLNHGSQDSPPSEETKLNHGSQQAQSRENESSITGAPKQPQAPPPMIEEPIMGLTNHKNPPPNLPPSAEKNLEERLGDSYAKHTGNELNMAGMKKVKALEHGHGTEEVAGVFDDWLKHRNLEGVKYPLILFVQEFPEAQARNRNHKNQQAAKAANARQAEESAAAVADWRKQFGALQFDGWGRGTEEWVRQAEDWVKANPPPTWWVESEEGLAQVDWQPEEIIKWGIKMARTYASEEHDRLTHDPDNSFCACQSCQPDFWKDRASA